MSAAFTSGPWRKGKQRKIYAEGVELPVAQAVAAEREYAEATANARLIAASPTMADYIQRKADEGDEEAALIMETIHGRG